MSVSISRWLDSDGQRPLADLGLDTLGALPLVTSDLAVPPREAPYGSPTELRTSELASTRTELSFGENRLFTNGRS